MVWWAVPAITAAIGAMGAARKQAGISKYNQGQAEVTRYSPWTGMQGQISSEQAPSMLEGGIAGGIQGMGMAQGFGGMGGGGDAMKGVGSAGTQNVGMLDGQKFNMMKSGNSSPWMSSNKPSLFA